MTGLRIGLAVTMLALTFLVAARVHGEQVIHQQAASSCLENFDFLGEEEDAMRVDCDAYGQSWEDVDRAELRAIEAGTRTRATAVGWAAVGSGVLLTILGAWQLAGGRSSGTFGMAAAVGGVLVAAGLAALLFAVGLAVAPSRCGPSADCTAEFIGRLLLLVLAAVGAVILAIGIRITRRRPAVGS